MAMLKICVLTVVLVASVVDAGPIERMERVETNRWYLGMNLNPADGHIMDYTTGWTDDVFLGTYTEALTKDYLNRMVWRRPVSFIAIVRHQKGEVDAVKVFRFKENDRSLLSRFQAMDPGREVVTEGGPLQESVSNNAQNMEDDPIFSVGGDLAFNWANMDNGHRVVMTGGYLTPFEDTTDSTHGLGNHFSCNPRTGKENRPVYSHEISNIQGCCNPILLQGTDHGDDPRFRSGPVYGNYAIYLSEDATSFPGPGYKLALEVDVEQTLNIFKHGSEF